MEFPAHKMGREWRFDTDELDAWLRNEKSSQKDIEVK
jgi:hypothetical protein